jgi:hypothetical protein
MKYPINLTTEPISLRSGDGVAIRSDPGPMGLERVELDLSQRQSATHCLVLLPASPNDLAPGSAARRLRMTAAYRDERGGREPFHAYLISYRAGEAIAEDRTRFFAGSEAAPLVLDLSVDPAAEHAQLMVYADRTYRGVLELTGIRLAAGLVERGIGQGEDLRRHITLDRRWRQEGERVICASPFGEHWADMPPGWRLDDVHPAALRAADWLIFSGATRVAFGVKERPPAPEADARRSPGTSTLLSYSLGTDSTAAMTLLPDDTIRYDCRRPYGHYFTRQGSPVPLPDPAPWHRRLERVANLISIPNTFELVQIAAGGRHGFAHGFGYGAFGMLLADHTNAGTLAFGSVMEQIHLRSGNLFADVVALPSSLYNGLRRLCEGAGLRLALPTAGTSEVLTARIADTGRFGGLAISCPSASADGEPCGTCFKCFRKLRLTGGLSAADAPDPAPSVLRLLEKYPLKSATSVVYAAQRSGFRHPGVDRYRDVDLGLLERYFGYALEHMLPPHLRDHAAARLHELGIQPMSDDDEYRLRTLGRVFWPEEFSVERSFPAS